MQKSDLGLTDIELLSEAEFFTHAHLPVAAAYCRRLGVIELVNSLVPSQMRLQPGVTVQAMVLDVLSGRSPLYHLEESMRELDIELLIGEDLPAELFNDTNLARSMDAIFESGSSKIITALGVEAVKSFNLEAKIIRYDTTSTSVWGNFAECEDESPPEGPRITHGHSKDKRPDLKQFMTELLCVARSVPIFGKTLDGNSSDKTSNNKMLTRISSIMARHGLGSGAFVYVADAAVVTEGNLKLLEGQRFITRLPANFSECSRVIEKAVDSNKWVELGVLAQTPAPKNRSHASYKCHETEVVLYGNPYRALVIHSTTHDKRRQKKLERLIEKSSSSITDAMRKLPKKFYCKKDALEAAKSAEKLSDKLHEVKTTIEVHKVRKRGRPPRNAPHPTVEQYSLSWEVIPNEGAINREKELAGCFVLISNIAAKEENPLSSEEILQTYKGQYAIEGNFSFLKDPLIVNDLFLKKPHRIDVLGMVLIIALMIWRLMEHSLRTHIEKNDETLPGWNKTRTKRPTAYMTTWLLRGIKVVKIGQQRVLSRKPDKRQSEVLAALGVNNEVYVNPQFKCVPIEKENNEKLGPKG